MRKVSHHHAHRHDLSRLPLFSCTDQVPASPQTYGVSWVSRRAGLPPQIANTVTDLAGIRAQRTK